MPFTAFCGMATHLLFPAQTLRLGQLEETVIDRVNQGQHGHIVHLWGGEQEVQEAALVTMGSSPVLALGHRPSVLHRVTALASPSGSQRCCR